MTYYRYYKYEIEDFRPIIYRVVGSKPDTYYAIDCFDEEIGKWRIIEDYSAFWSDCGHGRVKKITEKEAFIEIL